MLTEIRDRSSGFFAWVIAALIIIPMAFFGVQQYADTEARPTIVEIGENKITQQQFQSRLTQIQNQRLAQNPQLASSGILNSKEFKKNIFDSMVNQELVAYIADDNGYQISDKAIDKLIANDPTFQTDGKFDQAVYEAQMARYGRGGSKVYKADLRRNFRIGQVVSGYEESALVLPEEVRSLLEIQAERRTFDIITINQADFVEGIQVSDDDVSKYYQENIANFQEPERVSLSYVELDTQRIAESVEVDDATLEKAYEEYTSGFQADETRNTRHILLSTNDGEEEQAQLAKAEGLVTQLREGADFAALATEHSKDPGSAQNGGSLGEVERGEMVPEFDEKVFELAEGEISDPVKTQFGYHIIQVEKINATQAETFETMSFQLKEEEQLRVAQDRVTEQAEKLKNLVYEQSDSLEPAAKELGLTILTTELFSRAAGDGIASNEAVRSAAFSETVMKENFNSELLEISDGVFVAIRKLDFAAAEPKKLADVSEQIKSTLTTERAITKAKETGESVLERAEQNWIELAKDENVNVETHSISMIDTERKVAPDVIREIVKIRLDDTATKVISFEGLGGDFNIVRLTQIAPGDLSEVSEAIKDSTRRLVAQRNGSALIDTYLDGLNKELKLEINEDLL